jgi:hypothetical protein
MDWMLATDLSVFILTVDWAWPVSETLHFIGLVMLAGTVGMFDLRVLGVGRGIPPTEVHKLLRVGMLGFAISVSTGTLFVFGTPDQYFYNSAFHVKVVGLALMGANVAVFYGAFYQRVRTLGAHDDAPLRAKVSAALSIALLVTVMCAGRMLTFFRPL